MRPEVLQRLERFLPSQKSWMLSPETERVMMGGWRASKTFALCRAAVFLSYLIPDNSGFIGRASGKDLHSTTIQTFFDEVCPGEMIVGKPRKIGQSGLEVTLRTRFEGYTSKIYFDYIIDRSTNRSHLAGGNWGWFGVDQMEEIGRGDWHKLMGRLSRTYYHPELKKKMPIKTHALGVGNQMGHDWIFEDFFQGGDYIFDIHREPQKFFKVVQKSNRFGMIVRSEQNAISNGGFVPDEYFANLRATMPPEWIARYMDGSFDDFSGKIYSEYNLTSVHNIEPFSIPSHWPWYCAIDPGGSVPWGVVIVRVDEMGNSIITNDAESLYKANVNPIHALNWVKKYTPVEKTRYAMDYQNIPVMQLFLDAGVYCEPAMKDRKVGLQGAQAAFHINPLRPLPEWYKETQPKERYEKFKAGGSPQVFTFNTNKRWMKEHDDYIWDPVKKNEPKEGQHDHLSDSTRYHLASNPQPAARLTQEPYEFRNTDPTSAYHLDQVTKEIARLTRKDAIEKQRNSDACDGGSSDEPQTHFIQEFGNYF